MTNTSSTKPASSAHSAGDARPDSHGQEHESVLSLVVVKDGDSKQFEIEQWPDGRYALKAFGKAIQVVVGDGPIELFKKVDDARIFGTLNLHDEIMAALFAVVFKKYAEGFSSLPLKF